MLLKTDAIKQFLCKNTEPDLAALYNAEMEVQVNVAKGNGEKVLGKTSSGHNWWGWTDTIETWKNIRIPWNAKENPTYIDSPLNYDVKHFEGIGLTGWNWKQQKSVWVGYDFDSIIGHKKGLSEVELLEIQDAVNSCPWATIRRSTSGAGVHIYVFFATPPETKTHDEHAALARAVLGYLSLIINHQLEVKVDTCGGILWVWHRRRKEQGFKLIRAGEPLTSIPPNWREHVTVIQRRAVRVPFSGDQAIDNIMMKTKFISLTEQHKRLLGWFERNKESCLWWWDSDRYMLVCHTSDLKKSHAELNLQGIFETLATGKEAGIDQNCFAYPLQVGWVVRRHHKGTPEHTSWETDSSGWSRCFFDRPANIATASRTNNGAESKDGSFIFKNLDDALRAVDQMALKLEAPAELSGRPTALLGLPDGRVVVSVVKEKQDPWVDGWAPDGKKWQKILRTEAQAEAEVPDENVRHLVALGTDAGWYFKTHGEEWVAESRANIEFGLSALGSHKREVDLILGNCVLNYWTFVIKPFQPEYLGNRIWNKDAPQLAFIPKPGQHLAWDKIFDHLGIGLTEAVEGDDWCRRKGINTGSDYLKLWVSALFQYPDQPLPYLFFYSREQNTGKTTFHEALAMLFRGRKGYVRADVSLKSSGRFNGELSGAVLCIIEEIDLKSSKEAYERMKDWVTGKTISIHPKGGTPYEQDNMTHWIQCANNRSNCPVLPGDTRVVVCKVNTLKDEIPKEKFLETLKDEAPYFLDTLLHTEVPETNGRLRVPPVASWEKREQQDVNQDPVSLFIMSLRQRDGYSISYKDLYLAFKSLLPEAQHMYWPERRFVNELPDWVVRGKRNGIYHIANFTLLKFDECLTDLPQLVRREDRLITCHEAMAHDLARVRA